MQRKPFFFEQKHILQQLAAALDDIIIKRIDADGTVRDLVESRVVYGTKQKVFADIINRDKTLSLPVVSFWKTGIKYDSGRVINKYKQFHEDARITNNIGDIIDIPRGSAFDNPQPIIMNISCSIMTKFGADMDQIESNLFTFFQPYIVLITKVPDEYNLAKTHEIRHIVEWDGNISYQDYTTSVAANGKIRFVANTTFTVKGWLFKDRNEESDLIYKVISNYNEIGIGDIYKPVDDLESLKGPITDTFIFTGEPRPSVVLFDTVPYTFDVNDGWSKYIEIDTNLLDNGKIEIRVVGANMQHVQKIAFKDLTLPSNIPAGEDILIDYQEVDTLTDAHIVEFDVDDVNMDTIKIIIDVNQLQYPLTSDIQLYLINNAGYNTLPIIKFI